MQKRHVPERDVREWDTSEVVRATLVQLTLRSREMSSPDGTDLPPAPGWPQGDDSWSPALAHPESPYGQAVAYGPAVPGTPSPMEAPPMERTRGLGVLGTIIVAAVTALIVGVFAGLVGYAIGRVVTAQVQAAPATPAVPVAVPSSTPAPVVVEGGGVAPIRAVVEAVLPSVVSIQVESAEQSGSGSGFVLRPDGYILTNHHVVELAGANGTITVVLNDGTKRRATVVGSNADYDIAVLKVPLDGLRAVAIGDSSAVQVGDAAIAIGAPLGLDGTVTSGIISAVDRPVTAGDSGTSQAYINAIQTDAAINPGNSGGPLLDASGRVIGVNSAIATMGASGQESGSIGLGFAIPMNSALRIADELITSGHASTPIIGVTLDTSYEGDGAKVQTVTAKGPSAVAGLQPGDILTTLDDRVINDATELVVAIRDHRPGDLIVLGYLRDGQAGTARVTLGSTGDTAP